MMIWNEQNKVFSTISKENYIPSQDAGTRYIYCNIVSLWDLINVSAKLSTWYNLW